MRAPWHVPKQSNWTRSGILTRLIPVIVAGYLVEYAVLWGVRTGLSAVGVDAYDPAAPLVVRVPLWSLGSSSSGRRRHGGPRCGGVTRDSGRATSMIGVLAAAVPTVIAPPLIDGLLGPISGMAEALVVLVIYACMTVVVVITAFALVGSPHSSGSAPGRRTGEPPRGSRRRR